MIKVVKLCDVCKKEVVYAVKVAVDNKLFRVCTFSCKDVLAKGRDVDLGCGIIDGDTVRDVRMCNECTLLDMSFNCYASRRDRGMVLMFVVFGRRKGV